MIILNDMKKNQKNKIIILNYLNWSIRNLMIFFLSKFNDNFFKYMKYSILKNGCETIIKNLKYIFFSLFKK